MKIKEAGCKIYKPEILICPICKSKLKYCYTLSNKVIQFSSGRIIRIKNLGYKCPLCNDTVYFSQAANKFAFKGYTYSAKIACYIAYYKELHYGRESICDILSNKGIEISDRNIDIIYKKFISYLNMDYDLKIKEAYKNMLDKYNEIRLSIDYITIENKNYVIMYDFFTGDILMIIDFNGLNDPKMNNILQKYINDEYNITTIFTVRSFVSSFQPYLKSIAPKRCKFYAFAKF